MNRSVISTKSLFSQEATECRELILPTSAILVRDSNSGLLKVASKSDIESNVLVYMQSGENVVGVEMLRYAGNYYS